jgi:hypothetical protein
MGLPVLLSVLTEDRDDLDLLKGALEVLQLSVALPQDATAQQQQANTDVSYLVAVAVSGALCLPGCRPGRLYRPLQSHHTPAVSSCQSGTVVSQGQNAQPDPKAAAGAAPFP